MGDYDRTERKYLVTSTKKMVPRTSFRYRVSKLNQPGGMFNLAGGQFNPHLKHWAIIFLILTGTIGGILWYTQPTNPLFHSTIPNPQHVNPDPFNPIWQSTCPSCAAPTTLPGWKTYNGTNGGENNFIAAPCVFGSVSCLDQGSDTTITSVALTSSSVGDLGVVNGKNLAFFMNWNVPKNGAIGANSPWGFYLTTNSTPPTHDIGSNAAYRPEDDPSVVFLQKYYCSSTCDNTHNVINANTYFLRNQGTSDTINGEDAGCTYGSVFLCASAQISGNTFNFLYSVAVTWLNYTGSTNSGGCTGPVNLPNFSTITGGGPGCSVTLSFGQSSTQLLPPSSLLTNQLYLGFYVSPGLTSDVKWFFNPTGINTGYGMLLSYYVPSPTAIVQPPNIDTGGFFGPILKWLISGGVFILKTILSFASFLWTILQPVFSGIMNLLVPILATLVSIILGVITAILNAIGNSIGLGNLGTNLSTFLTDIGGFFTTFFGNSLAQLSSFITFLVNGYATVSASFSTYWTDVANWTTGLKDFLGGLWVIANQLFTISFALIFSGWLLYGAKRFSDGVGEGMEWFGLTRQFLMLGVAIALFVFTITLHYVLIPGFHMIQSIGEAKKTAEPDIEIGGTGVG